MTVFPDKRLEMVQTLRSMIGQVKRENGCLSHSVFFDLRDENRFCILETWKMREDLDRHIATDRFAAFLGARVLLCEPLDVQIYTATKAEGIEAVHAVRNKEKASS